ncbi:TylF/MycF family methyltransferase [Pendulispora brunnea]|uniref:TylF/MycF family methyltransferase n=1 Tax=Pendulispora brunnea TaxID=2905690 RepID=A0ABZ2JYL3_9BACT
MNAIRKLLEPDPIGTFRRILEGFTAWYAQLDGDKKKACQRHGFYLNEQLSDFARELPEATLAVIAGLMKAANRSNPLFKVSFAFDPLNAKFGVKDAYPFIARENVVRGLMANVEQSNNIQHLLSQVLLLDVPGHVVELGCHEGITALLMKMTMASFQSTKPLWVFDSFEGLPAPCPEDGEFTHAGMMAATQQSLIENFVRMELEPPNIVAGWFDDTLRSQLPAEVAFAHLDGDLYSSIQVSLREVYPRLARNAIVVIDDYVDERLQPGVVNPYPGVKRACDEFFADKPEKVEPLWANWKGHAYFRKL